jgi:hypothetical protein
MRLTGSGYALMARRSRLSPSSAWLAFEAVPTSRSPRHRHRSNREVSTTRGRAFTPQIIASVRRRAAEQLLYREFCEQIPVRSHCAVPWSRAGLVQDTSLMAFPDGAQSPRLATLASAGESGDASWNSIPTMPSRMRLFRHWHRFRHALRSVVSIGFK